MKLSLRRIVLCMLVQAFCLSAAIADRPIEKPVVADTPDKFAATATQIRAEMSPGGRYEFIRPDDKGKAEVDLNSIASMLQKAVSVAAMKEEEKVQLYNTQEHLNGILTHSDSNRLVCERRAPVGTNIPLTTCKTVAEIEKARRDSQKYMQDHAQDANINSAAINRASPAKGG